MSNPTVYRQELRDRILMASMQLFRRHGIRNVKMEDVAKSLTISKRTLYEVYDNKEELLLEGLKYKERVKEQRLQETCSLKNNDVMTIILQHYRIQMKELEGVNPIIFSELKRYPRIVEYMERKRLEHNEEAKKFFARGIKEGYFRGDLDSDLVLQFTEACVNLVEQKQLYNKYELSYLFRNLIMIFMRGYCTPKGVEVLDKYM